MKIKVHIERLVLDGLPVSRLQGPLVQRAVERELTRMITTGGISHELQAGGAAPARQGGIIRVEKGGPPGAIGKQIAGAVYGGIGNKKR